MPRKTVCRKKRKMISKCRNKKASSTLNPKWTLKKSKMPRIKTESKNFFGFQEEALMKKETKQIISLTRHTRQTSSQIKSPSTACPASCPPW